MDQLDIENDVLTSSLYGSKMDSATSYDPKPDSKPSQGENDVSTSTLYVSGFPLDIRYREIRNIFQYFPGFTYSRLVAGGKVPIAFATFDTYENALACKNRMAGTFFEEDTNVDLRLEFAKSEKRNQIQARKRGLEHPRGRREGVPAKRVMKEESMTLLIKGLSSVTKLGDIKPLVDSLEGFVGFRWSPSKRIDGTPLAYVDFRTAEYGLAARDAINGQVIDSVQTGIVVRVAEKQQSSFPSRGRQRGRGDMGMGMRESGRPPYHPRGMPPFDMGQRYQPDFYSESRQYNRGGRNHGGGDRYRDAGYGGGRGDRYRDGGYRDGDMDYRSSRNSVF